MLETNPFSLLAETVSPFAMQSFIIAMIVLIALGTIIQMIHHKNLTYFLDNAKKAKLQATREIGAGERASIIAKTTVVDIGTTSELGFGKRRLSHVLGMYGTIIFWISSVMLVFCYTGADKSSSSTWSTALLTPQSIPTFPCISRICFFVSGPWRCWGNLHCSPGKGQDSNLFSYRRLPRD